MDFLSKGRGDQSFLFSFSIGASSDLCEVAVIYLVRRQVCLYYTVGWKFKITMKSQPCSGHSHSWMRRGAISLDKVLEILWNLLTWQSKSYCLKVRISHTMEKLQENLMRQSALSCTKRLLLWQGIYSIWFSSSWRNHFFLNKVHLSVLLIISLDIQPNLLAHTL